MLVLFEKLKSLVVTTDFFYSTRLLRYQEDNQYKTFTGGAISIAIIITIIIGFANMILNTLNLNSFKNSVQIIKNSVPTPLDVQINENSRFRMAFEIWRHNLSDTRRYFDVTLILNYQQYSITTNITSYPLQTCTKEYFKDYPEISNNFDSLQAGDWLCIPLNTTLSVEGKYSSASYRQYIVNVSACKNQTEPNRPCASPEQIADFFAQKQNFLYFTVYFTNTQINPDKKDYKKYYIADQSYAIFGSNLGSETFLYLSDYTVKTDYSIWPFASTQLDTGSFVQELAANHPFETSIDGSFITFNIVKSLNSVIFTRQVQKLSAVFSFIGGMIGAVSAVLFVIKAYTNLSFQFAIAFEIFKKKKEKKNKQKNYEFPTEKTQIQQVKEVQKKGLMEMNLGNFIKYQFYEFLQGFGCKYMNHSMNYAKECKDEILKQLDVKILLQRIIFIEHCLTYLIDDYQLNALQLSQPQNLEQIRKTRIKCKSIIDYQIKFSTQLKLQNQFYSEGGANIKPKKQYITPESNFSMHQDSPHFLRHAQTVVAIRKQRKKRRQQFDQLNNPVFFVNPKKDQIEECFQPSEGDAKSQKKCEDNKVIDISKRVKIRDRYLFQLEKKAQEGNQISHKIMKNITKDMKS